MSIVKPLEGAESFFEVVRERHSVRRYEEHDIPDEDLRKMFEAARLAPSANNEQPWRFIVVKEKETKKLLARPSPQTFIADANAIVVVLGVPRDILLRRTPDLGHEGPHHRDGAPGAGGGSPGLRGVLDSYV